VFGEKDFQQLAVVRRMVSDLDMAVEVVGLPTVREPDGLAMSSRNQRLTPDSRRAAVCVVEALRLVAAGVADGVRDVAALLATAGHRIAAEPLASVEYVQIVDPLTLVPLTVVDRPAVVVAAVWFGDVRLIDNLSLDR
jgi:pantoate--beta-alanine ligase